MSSFWDSITQPTPFGPVIPSTNPPPVDTTAGTGYKSGPLGGDHLLNSPAKVIQAQQALRKAGFNISVDGINGPQTSEAYRAYLAGVKGAVWSATHSSTHHATAPANTYVQGSAGRGGSLDGQTSVHHPGVPAPSGKDPLAGILAGLTNQHYIDPKAFASETANGQFDPRINSLVQQMTQSKSDQANMQNNIGAWYADLVKQAGDTRGADLANEQALLSGSDAATKGLVDSLGGSANPAASDAAVYGTINHGELSTDALAHLSQLGDEGLSFAEQGVGQREDSARKYAEDLQTNLSNLSDLRAAKGDAYATALSNGYDKLSQQKKDAFNEAVSSSLAEPQLKAAQLANLRSAQALRAGNQQIKINDWRYKMGIEQAKTAAQQTSAANSVPKFTQQDPTKLANYLQSGVLGPKGNLNQNPMDVYNKIVQMTKTISYGKWDASSDPAVRQFLVGLVNSHLNAWNRQNPQNPYHFVGGQLVKGK